MAVNPYFNHVGCVVEQDLYHDIATEMIQLSGVDVQYVKSDALGSKNYDPVLGETQQEVLGKAVTIEMYLKDFEQPYGGDDFYSKFGLSTPFQATFIVGIRRFQDELGMRPREGDYIHIPSWGQLGPDTMFRIHKVDDVDVQWKALGSPVYYYLKCEKARFDHPDVSTGDDEIDYSAAVKENNDSVKNDRNADNDPLEDLTNLFIDFSENNPFGNP